MKQEHHDALRDRLIDLLERGEDPLTASTWQNPVSVYHDPDHLELERKHLFDQVPADHRSRGPDRERERLPDP